MHLTKKEFTPEMREISGFGTDSSYEQACRAMVIAGANWLDENPNAKLFYKEFRNIYGLTTDESEDMKILQDVMCKAANNDCTGAMMQACSGHVIYIKQNGWDLYVKQMSSLLEEEEEGEENAN